MITALIPLDVPVGWSNNPEDVDMLQAVLLLGGVPLLLFIGITLAVFVPSLVRGESITPGAPAVENQWLGGPRTRAGELAGPNAGDDQDPDSGGASGRW
ncbi:hypothetical protein [Nocardioides dilutus]